MDYSKLTSDKPSHFDYDTKVLEEAGYVLRWALDEENPSFKEACDRCVAGGLEYKIKQGEGRQKHIWVKGKN